MMAPAVGRVIAEGIVTATVSPVAAQLSPERFARDELIHEHQIV